MKVGILTFHRGGNAGAVMQCYALKTTIDRMCEAYVVDYFPNFMVDIELPKNYAKLKTYSGRERELLKLMDNRYTKYNVFRSNTLNYLSVQDAEELDCLVLGSDQLLNAELSNYDINYISPSFFHGKILMYAGSFGKAELPNNYYFHALKDALPRYQALSFREQSGLNLVQKYFGLSGQLVCDPTFLLGASDYKRLLVGFKHQYFQDYVFVYYPNKRVIECAIAYAKRHNYKVYVIATGQPLAPSRDYTIVYDDGPLDFLYLAANSHYNFVGSFHGACFSIIFHVPFVFFQASEALSERIIALKTVMGLPNCVNPGCFDESIVFDWSAIDSSRAKMSDQSFKWLQKYVN